MDGRPQDKVEDVAAAARASGIEIYAVGVDRADMKSLRLMASLPLDDHVFYVETYGVIEKLASKFRETLCGKDDEGSAETPPTYEGGFGVDNENDRKKENTGLDACSLGHYCQHTCVNSGNSFFCTCRVGYVLNKPPEQAMVFVVWLWAADQSSEACECFFTGSDACSQGHDCQHICVNNGDSYTCKCREGYTLNADRKTCSPDQSSEACECFFTGSDACSQGHDCQHICVNNGDSYTCKCREGYTLNADRKTCSHVLAGVSLSTYVSAWK
ncbi:hypothetical protein CRUP_026078 [Coryphaenoides rupestris]|nr:hypothetical protein CRUP_026078 [Coryphaenoides rupestris]